MAFQKPELGNFDITQKSSKHHSSTEETTPPQTFGACLHETRHGGLFNAIF